jgi:cytochrome oxidase Cu insertion factor (SCO1/SenC/PrrC family)
MNSKKISVRSLPLWTLVFAAFFLAAAVAVDLGPRDGAGMPPTDLERIKIGDKAPDFTLENLDGKKVALNNYRGKKNVVLVFYRGYW